MSQTFTFLQKLSLTLLLTQFVSCKVIDFDSTKIQLNSIFEKEIEENTKMVGKLVNFQKPTKLPGLYILEDLMKTSGRMEWLVGLLADLKTMLNQAIESDHKERGLRQELNLVRDEIKYLRDEVTVLKRNQLQPESYSGSNVKTELENEEVQWLTTGLTEVRQELRQLSNSFNVTTLLIQSNENVHNEVLSTKRNLDTVQKDLQELKAEQVKMNEDLKNFNSRPNPLHHIVPRELVPHPRRRHWHSELTSLSTTVAGLLNWTALLEQKLEAVTVSAGTRTLDETDDTRLIALETGLAETQNHVQDLKAELSGLEELRDSSKTLFNVLEALETKYDSRMTEFQETVSKMDVVTNKVSRVQEELKEEQISQWNSVRKSKSRLESNENRLAETHLRLSALQTHVVEWGIKTCGDELKEKGQDLRILKIEQELRNWREIGGKLIEEF